MYLAYKYAKKKHNQRKEERLAESGDAVPMNRYSTVTAEEPISGGTVADTASAVSNAKHGKEAAKKEPTPEELAEKKRRRKYRLKILLGLVAPFTLQALDMTIVASALPFIAADFSEYLTHACYLDSIFSYARLYWRLMFLPSLPQTNSHSSTGSSPPSTSPLPPSFPSGPRSPIFSVATARSKRPSLL